MPRRYFRRFSLKRELLEERWYLRPFRHLLADPRLTSIRRRSVVPAVAIGLFVAAFPFPGHFVAAALLAVALHANVVIAMLATLASNPVTIAPIVYANYRVGLALLDRPPQPFPFEPTLAWLTAEFGRVWEPLMLGSVVVGAAASAIAYVTLSLLWRLSVNAARKARRMRRH